MEEKISIIIPFLNEEDNIPELIKYLDENCKNKKFKSEIVFVDDGSTDNSLNLLQSQKYENFEAKVVSLSKNYGSHNAVRAGLLNASYDICTFFSADLQEPFEIIEKMYDNIHEGFDIVCAYKASVQVGIFEKLFSNTYSHLIQKYAVKDFPIQGINTVMFKKKIKDILNKNIEANSSIFLQILSLGFKKTFIPYSLEKRKHGKSKWTLSKKIKAVIDSFVSYSYTPIRLVSLLGILMFIGSIILLLITLLLKILNGDNMPLGYPTMIAVMLLGFGTINISIGIVAEYVWRALDVARNRPIFIIDKTIDLRRR